ncbi:peptidoglycan-binding protein [Nannocystis sp. ILAH1]|uniref:peptidoglycan-binding protein n=1 Tax=unclassified Nannocystis TaxID=2627009 RepID=UPI00226EF1AD|nr:MULTISPECIES: peptidoglycan-binding protein [unclassified Nannocystis]MCY0990593.1 peptidoglycan-binding protein [Nannocystis sp. ILAH1]MCY1072164.1 peptidoglycan-binding protein [Nannocystis sp. RBIL2]
MSRRHRVRPGDCVASLAEEHGLAPETLWDHPDNRELRQRRDDGQVLAPGDVLTIPAPRAKAVECVTDRQHRFKRRGVPIALRLRLLDDGEPRAHTRYRLGLGAREFAGETDANGDLHVWLPRGAAEGTLTIESDDAVEVYALQLGELQPASELEGVRQRLENLEYLWPTESEPEQLHRALKSFQLDHGLAPTGEADPPTRARLVAAHGS